jgi:hypothetical protein
MFLTLFGFGRKNRSSQRRGAGPGAVRRRWSPLSVEELEPRETPAVNAFVLGTELDVNCFNFGVNTVKVDHRANLTLISWTDSAGGSGLRLFNDATYTNIVISGGTLGTTSDILANVRPVSVFNRLEGDVVNVGGDGRPGSANEVQRIQAELTIANTGVHSIVNVHDENDANYRTPTLRHYWLGGIIDDAHEVHGVDGLGSSYLYFNRSVTRALNIHTGLGRADFTVQSTAALPVSGAIALYGWHNSGTDGLNDTVTVGNAGSVQQISGALVIANPSDFTNLFVDDSADAAFQSPILDTIRGVGRIRNLAPATISY